MPAIRLHMYGHCEHVCQMRTVGRQNCWKTFSQVDWKSWNSCSVALTQWIRPNTYSTLHKITVSLVDILGMLILHIQYFTCSHSELSLSLHHSFLKVVFKQLFKEVEWNSRDGSVCLFVGRSSTTTQSRLKYQSKWALYTVTGEFAIMFPRGWTLLLGGSRDFYSFPPQFKISTYPVKSQHPLSKTRYRSCSWFLEDEI